MKFIRILFELGKVKITLSVAFSTLTGYLLVKGYLDAGVIRPVIGIFLMACGSSALNQIQERKADALMERTKDRPLPSGRITLWGALVIALVYTLAGSLLLFLGAGVRGLSLGLLALIWYNGIYTPLKRLTPFAVLPGAVIGAVPPLVGWVAAGGHLTETGIIIIAFFFFIWQVPHFWLLALNFDADYEKAGYPTLTGIFTTSQIKRITFSWIVAMALTAMLVIINGIISSLIMAALTVITCLIMVWSFRGLLRRGKDKIRVKPAFMKVNLFFLLMILYIWIDRFIQ